MVSSVLQRPTLVLNRNWQPVGVTPVARSLVLVFNDTARFVDPVDYRVYSWSDWSTLRPEQDDLFIQSVQFRMRVPEVILLTQFDRQPRRVVPFSRRNLYQRDHYTCQYCGAQPGSAELTIDHVLPRSHGGLSTWDNCVLACVSCNKRKANRTPQQAHMPLRRAPIRPAWKPSYAGRHLRIDSWAKFLSEAYWNVELQD